MTLALLLAFVVPPVQSKCTGHQCVLPASDRGGVLVCLLVSCCVGVLVLIWLIMLVNLSTLVHLLVLACGDCVFRLTVKTNQKIDRQ
jgi:Flp pilus assembly protein TadB